MMSKMTTLLIFFVAATIIFVLGTQGEITITSDPEKIENNVYFTLTCHIGTVTDEVKWVYKGITYFSCISPYSAGQCFLNTSSPYLHRTNYDVNTTAGISTIRIYPFSEQLEGLWTCHHGRYSSTYNVNPGDGAVIRSFKSSPRRSNVTVGTNVTFTCKVSSASSLPVDVSIYSQTREGNLTYVTNSTSRTFIVSTIVQCTDYKFICRAYNGYFSHYILGMYKYIKCPVKLLLDKSNTTVNATVGSETRLQVHYSGYPEPSYTWYRRLSQAEVKLNSYRTHWSKTFDGSKYMYLEIRNLHIQDAGQYSVHINATGHEWKVSFTLNVNPVLTSNSENRTVDVPQQNFTVKGLCSATTQPFISAAGLGIGIVVGAIITLLVQGGVLLVGRMLKSGDK